MWWHRNVIFPSATLALGFALLALWPRTLICKDALTFYSKSGTAYEFSTAPHGICLCVTTHLRQVMDSLGIVVDDWSMTSDRWGSQRPLKTKPIPQTESSVVTYAGGVTNIHWSAPRYHLLGFGWDKKMGVATALPYMHNARVSYSGLRLELPIWLIVLLLGVITARGFRRWSCDSRRKSGRCAACGYDLRATPDRCPECGTAVDSARP